MTQKLILFIVVASLIGSTTYLVAAEDEHKHSEDDMHSGFAMSEDEHDHEKETKSEDHGHKHNDGDDKHKDEGHGDHSDHNDQGGHGDHEAGHDDHGDHGGEDGHEEHGDGTAQLSSAQLKSADIRVESLRLKKVANSLSAPGEVLFNAYQSKKVTPRISAQVIKRHKRLGDEVEKGQVLVSLSSVDMAQAQGDLIVADREWQRVKKLGKNVVSERRYVEAQIARQQAYAKVSAFGMTKSQITQLLKTGDPSKAVGRFTLLASQYGTITSDDFVEGEIIEPGQVLFEITDETTMWVEARLPPHATHNIKVGSTAMVTVSGHRLPAKVIQVHHKLDETTRTIAVRLEVENLDDELHPGLFVQAQINTGNDTQALALPMDAVLRSPDGDWVVFVEEEPGQFKPQEVHVVGQSGDLIKIKGISAGTRVVTKGAFFVQSEIAKSGFEVHNH